MRDIVFRGKRTDNGEWVCGDLTHSVYKLRDTCVGKYGSEIGMHQVDPATVSQYTGLTDKNGKRIFEGDLLVLATSRPHEVKFADGSFYMDGTAIAIHHARKFTIVGNRWDNPELLGEVTDNG
jgi:uncharacterized phage protein (TIGR01671 family)